MKKSFSTDLMTFARSAAANTDGHRFGMVNTNMFRPGAAHLDLPRPAAKHIGAVRSGRPQADPAYANVPGHDGYTAQQASRSGMQQTGQTPIQDIRSEVAAREPDSSKSSLQSKQLTEKSNAGSNMDSGAVLDFSAESLMRGFIISEVLGKPKSLRRGRW